MHVSGSHGFSDISAFLELARVTWAFTQGKATPTLKHIL